MLSDIGTPVTPPARARRRRTTLLPSRLPESASMCGAQWTRDHRLQLVGAHSDVGPRARAADAACRWSGCRRWHRACRRRRHSPCTRAIWGVVADRTCGRRALRRARAAEATAVLAALLARVIGERSRVRPASVRHAGGRPGARGPMAGGIARVRAAAARCLSDQTGVCTSKQECARCCFRGGRHMARPRASDRLAGSELAGRDCVRLPCREPGRSARCARDNLLDRPGRARIFIMSSARGG